MSETTPIAAPPLADDAPPPSSRARGRDAVAYDFRRPDRVSKDQIHSLHFLHERFARNLSAALSAYLRTSTDLTVVSVEQQSYSQFLAGLSDPTAFYALAIPPFDELGALEISPGLAFAMIDRMLGGGGQGQQPERALTEIEQNVIDSVVKLVLEGLTETWRPLVGLAFGIRGRETRPQMLQVAAPNETVVRVAFTLRVRDLAGAVHLCLPASIVETTGSNFGQTFHRERREPTVAERAWLRENLSRVPMPLTAMVRAHITARELLALESGDVLALDVPASKPIDLCVGETLKFRGRLTVDGQRTSVRIEHRCDQHGVEEA